MEIPLGYCQCGCGLKTNIATVTRKGRNQVKGQPLRYAKSHNKQVISPSLKKSGESWCCKCRESKSTEKFWTRKKDSQGNILQYSAMCKQCSKKNTTEYRKNNPEKERAYSLKYRLRTKYNISPEKYQEMLDSQNGTCKICEHPESITTNNTPRLMAVDHCHKTGKIRGLLCNNCNRAIGLIKEDVSILQKAIEYLS